MLCLTSVLTFILLHLVQSSSTLRCRGVTYTKAHFCPSVYQDEVHRPICRHCKKCCYSGICIFFLFILFHLLARMDILSQFATERHMFYLSYYILSCFITTFLTEEGNLLFSLGARAQILLEKYHVMSSLFMLF
jgi:hypothetical protein